MPGSNALPSYLGNLTNARAKMAGVRQRLSLEPGPKTQTNSLRAIAPSPPEGADMDVKGAAIKTMSGSPQPGPSMAQEPPEHEALMNRSIQDHPNYAAMRDVAQKFGSTKRVYYRTYQPDKLKITL